MQHRNRQSFLLSPWLLLAAVLLGLAAGCRAGAPAAALPTRAAEADFSPATPPAAPPTATPAPTATAPPADPASEPAPPTAVPTGAAPESGAEATGAPAPTPAPPITHTVAAGETLLVIAQAYGVSADAIAAANGVQNVDLIAAGQVLTIPGAETAAAPAQATPGSGPGPKATPPAGPLPSLDAHSPPPVEPAWAPSLISGDLANGYPLVRYTPDQSIRLHAQPGTYPEPYLDALGPRIQDIFLEIQAAMGGRVPQVVDVYLAGTLFEINPALQGFSQSQRFRSFILVNGVYHPGERDYILGHELTHVAATNLLGRASSTMIHEGVAVALPYHYLQDNAGYLPLAETCAIAYQDRARSNAFRPATVLRQYNYEDGFRGHIRTFFNYHLSGCFVDFLLAQGGMEALDRVYDGGNYSAVYGQSFAALDAAWQASLAETPVSVDPARFVDAVAAVGDAYERYIRASEDGIHANYPAYLALNEARLALNRGNLDEAEAGLATYNSLMAR